jgi:hypothetical protein
MEEPEVDEDQQVVLEELYDENYEPTEAGSKHGSVACTRSPLVPLSSLQQQHHTATAGLFVCRDTGVCQMAGYGHR